MWQRSVQLSVAVYEFSKTLPREEMYGLTSQLRRASVSIVSNIAEGHGRDSTPQLLHFLSMARGSTFEVEAQLCLALELKMGDAELSGRCDSLCDEVSRMLFAAMNSLRTKLQKTAG